VTRDTAGRSAHGVRRRLAPREHAETGWSAMTDSELAVARLVAQGLTNREVAEQLYVSPHTVSSHLRSIFAKLGVNSRVALTRLAGAHDRTPPHTAARATAAVVSTGRYDADALRMARADQVLETLAPRGTRLARRRGRAGRIPPWCGDSTGPAGATGKVFARVRPSG
jgi:DNA-binding CsgD family transcriptional regulator